MSYALRNTLILSGILALVLAVGGYWLWVRQAERARELLAREKALAGELDRVHAAMVEYDTTLAVLDGLKARWNARTQVVPPDDTPAQTLDFLNGLRKASDMAVHFDFLFKGRRDRGGYSVNAYALEGEGRFEDLYAFLWRLEHGRRFYTVDQLEIFYREGKVYTPRWDWVSFKMLFRAYYEPGSRIEAPPLSVREGPPHEEPRNPFRPMITQSIPENSKDLFEVDGARLEGLTHNLAYLVDRNGRRSLLREGDRVYLGELSGIDMDHNRVRFVLNRGGIWERVELTVGMERQK